MYDQDGNDGADLGIALPAIGSAISTVGGIFKGSKDPGRLQANAQAYSAAIAGNPQFKDAPSALSFLLQKSPVSKGGSGGWATSVAQNDAYAKYTQAKAIIAKQQTSGTTPKSTAYAQPKPTIGGPVIAGLSTGPLLIAGVAAAAIFAMSGKRRR